MGTSSLELLRHLLCANRGADLKEQPARLTKLALARGFVTGKAGQLAALDVEKGLVALGARHLEPGIGFGEGFLDVLRRLDAGDLAESADSDEQSRELPESGAASAADGNRFLGERQSPRAITEPEICCHHRRNYTTFYCL